MTAARPPAGIRLGRMPRPAAPPPYSPLWCKSNYSFLEGASHPAELVDRAHALGLPALALTDRGGVYGLVRAHVRAKELGVKLLCGAEMDLAGGGSVVLLTASSAGYPALCRLITLGRLRSPKGVCTVTLDELCAAAGGLYAFWPGRNLDGLGEDPDPVPAVLRDAFGDLALGLAVRDRTAAGSARERRLRAACGAAGVPVAAAVEVLYHDPARRDLQDVLTCIRHGVDLAHAGRRIRPNAEYGLKPPEEFSALFRDDPAAVRRTLDIADACTFSLDSIRYRYPSEDLPDGETSSSALARLARLGAERRYPEGVPPAVADQIGRELALVDELDYCGYFLTMYEIVEFCRRNGILCQGRGSAANSAVCFCLGVTAVDPVRVDLLFERFLSRERAEPPDIDLDIQNDRREEVIRFVYAKYGRDRAAMAANVVRYRGRSAVREVGKALGVPETALHRFAAGLPDGLGGPHDPSALADAGPSARHLLRLAEEIQGFPRHLSIHPGGFLLGGAPIADLVPVENATMPGRTVIQWDKDDLGDLGLFKVDLLGLGALAQLDLSFRLLERHYGRRLTAADIPEGDPATYRMIRRGDTVGVFQIESRAQTVMLPRLRPRNYYDLVIQLSIVRPGPITGGMVHPYLRRRRGEEPVEYPHPCLEPVLRKTLGVPLFQEQVMRLAVVAAGYAPGEADQLRRDMAAWKKDGNRVARHRERLVGGMAARGIPAEFAERVFDQIRGFGEYGFPESHAASFALLAYATSWLRCRYPDVFTCALLNAQPMGFYAPATIVDDAKRRGVEVRPVDILSSGWDCTLEPAPARGPAAAPAAWSAQREAPGGPRGPVRFSVRMGLRYVKGLSRTLDYPRIEAARAAGAAASVRGFTVRADLRRGAAALLAAAGAFSRLGAGRREAVWTASAPVPAVLPLFPPAAGPGGAPAFPPLGAGGEIMWDYRTSGHSARGHPLSVLRPKLSAARIPDARTLAGIADGRRINYAGLVICRQRPGTAGGVVFMTLEDETGFVNLVVWERIFDRYRVVARTAPFLGVTGKIQSGEGVVNLVAESLWIPQLGGGSVQVGSRDFK